MNRREFLQNTGPMAGIGIVAPCLINNSEAYAASSAERIDAGPSARRKLDVTNELSRSVQMQFMQPDQLEAAARKFPVAYVPFGLIEWHTCRWAMTPSRPMPFS